jgi:hypothetical protein
MDVLNGLHIEPDDHESKLISKGIDLRKPATEHDLTSQAETSLPIDLRKPNPSYDDRTIDTLSTYPLLLYPTGRYQQSIGTSTDYVSVGDKWFITLPYLQSLDMLRNWSASRLQSLIGKPTDRSLCHAFVALSDP